MAVPLEALTDDWHARVTRVLVRKATLLTATYPPQERTEAIVSMVIADTALICTGAATIEQYEPSVDAPA